MLRLDTEDYSADDPVTWQLAIVGATKLGKCLVYHSLGTTLCVYETVELQKLAA